jgi:predicted kinase
VVCDQAIAEQRIATRDDVSDADVDVYRRFQDEFDPVEGDHTVVDNSGSKVETYRQLDTLF